MRALIPFISTLLALIPISSPFANDHIKASISGPAKTMPGRPFQLTVSLDIDPGWHVQSNKAKDPYIPTRLTMKGPNGFRAGQAAYPSSTRMNFGGEMLDVFTGRVPIKVLVTPPANAKGKQTLNLQVDYQICNDQSCLPPNSLKIAYSVAFGGSK